MKLPKVDYPMIEEIVLWNTLFEDRSILKEKLRKSMAMQVKAV